MGEQNDDRGPVSDGTGDLPAGHEWQPAGRQASALRRGLYVLALANVDGTWTAVGDLRGTATRRPGESLLAAAQREATAALWARDGFGVGEVRGLCLRGADRERIVRAWAMHKATALPNLSGVWSLAAMYVGVVSGPDAEVTIDARRVDAGASGEHATDCAYFFADAADAESLCDCGKAALANTAHLATPASEGTGASLAIALDDATSDRTWARVLDLIRADGLDPEAVLAAAAKNIEAWKMGPPTVTSAPLLPADHPLDARSRRVDAVGLVREPFVPSAKAAAEMLEVLARVGDGDAARPVLTWTKSESFPDMRDEWEAYAGPYRLHVDRHGPDDYWDQGNGGIPYRSLVEAQLGAETALRARLPDSMRGDRNAFAALNAATGDAPFLVALRAWEKATRGANDVIVYDLPATLALLDATRSTLAAPADAVAITLAAEQSIRNWLRAHGHDPDARPWDEVVIALLTAELVEARNVASRVVTEAIAEQAVTRAEDVATARADGAREEREASQVRGAEQRAEIKALRGHIAEQEAEIVATAEALGDVVDARCDQAATDERASIVKQVRHWAANGRRGMPVVDGDTYLVDWIATEIAESADERARGDR